MPPCITYKGGYKYQLTKRYTHETGIKVPRLIVVSPFLVFDHGRLSIMPGYAWDGPSGPTIDTPSFMRGSLVHDALYQLIREGHLGEEHRLRADELLFMICREDGMSPWRAQYVYWAVRWRGDEALGPKKVLRAPKDCEDNNQGE